MTQYDTTIGLEIHVQLKTKSKMFCASSAEYFGADPNSHVCPVCLGLPGALPVINKRAIEAAVKFALGLNCKISSLSKFDRKNYFYPDLPKGYQISQFDLPIGKGGWINVNGKKIRINRAHQEEDTGKLIHATVDGDKVSLVDFNRSGVPLLEIVSEPDIESPQEARLYAKKIHQVARYLEVADVDMEKAGMRFDANVSVRQKGETKLGEKVEIKNINSFRFLEKAIEYEVVRQIKVLESGEKVTQETRGWVEDKGVTVSQRTKETSPDYRYFPEPDLPPLTFQERELEKIRRALPELPDSKQDRFESEYGLDKNSTQIIIEDNFLAQWFEEVINLYNKNKNSLKKDAKVVANWVSGELLRKLHENNLNIKTIPLEPASFVELLRIIDDGMINQAGAKMVFDKMFESGEMPRKIIEDGGLNQLSSEGELNVIVDKVLESNPKAVEDYKKGKKTSFGFLLGQVMRQTEGRANPQVSASILENKLTHGD